MMTVSIPKKFIEIACEVLDVEDSAVVAEARFNEDLEADSIDLIEISGAVERAFDVEIADEELYELETVGAFAALIASKQS